MAGLRSNPPDGPSFGEGGADLGPAFIRHSCLTPRGLGTALKGVRRPFTWSMPDLRTARPSEDTDGEGRPNDALDSLQCRLTRNSWEWLQVEMRIESRLVESMANNIRFRERRAINLRNALGQRQLNAVGK